MRDKLAEKDLLARSPRRAPEDHLMKLVAAIAIADTNLSLRDIAANLDRMGERPVRGGKKWQPSSATCWTKPTDMASSAIEGAAHQATDRVLPLPTGSSKLLTICAAGRR